MQSQAFFEISELNVRRELAGNRYFEFLRIPAMSAGIYVLRAGGTDAQKPHAEDEMYYVVRGRARMQAGSEEREVQAGTIIFIAAGVEHRFHRIEEELVVLVFFAPAEKT